MAPYYHKERNVDNLERGQQREKGRFLSFPACELTKNGECVVHNTYTHIHNRGSFLWIGKNTDGVSRNKVITKFFVSHTNFNPLPGTGTAGYPQLTHSCAQVYFSPLSGGKKTACGQR
jgi:hypothetical protein